MDKLTFKALSLKDKQNTQIKLTYFRFNVDEIFTMCFTCAKLLKMNSLRKEILL